MAHGDRQDAILDAFQSPDEVLRPSEIADRSGLSAANVRSAVREMLEIGLLQQPAYGKYALPGEAESDRGTASSGSQELATTESDKGYPYMTGGVGAGKAGGVQHWEGERVYVPNEIVANWTGGQVPAYDEAYWTRVRGTSMEPWLPEETPIFVVRCEDVGADGRYVLYLDDDHAEVVKRVEKLGGGVYLLKPDNPAHDARKLRRIDNGDDHMYEDLTNDLRVYMRVRGRVVYPTDSPQAILRTFTQQMAEVLRQR